MDKGEHTFITKWNYHDQFGVGVCITGQLSNLTKREKKFIVAVFYGW